jgi:hypothetical protein
MLVVSTLMLVRIFYDSVVEVSEIKKRLRSVEALFSIMVEMPGIEPGTSGLDSNARNLPHTPKSIMPSH